MTTGFIWVDCRPTSTGTRMHPQIEQKQLLLKRLHKLERDIYDLQEDQRALVDTEQNSLKRAKAEVSCAINDELTQGAQALALKVFHVRAAAKTPALPVNRASLQPILPSVRDVLREIELEPTIAQLSLPPIEFPIFEQFLEQGKMKYSQASETADVKKKQSLYLDAIQDLSIVLDRNPQDIYALSYLGFCKFNLASSQEYSVEKRRLFEEVIACLPEVGVDHPLFSDVKFVLGKCKSKLVEFLHDPLEKYGFLEEAFTLFSMISLTPKFQNIPFLQGICKLYQASLEVTQEERQKRLQEAKIFLSKVTPDCSRYNEAQFLIKQCK